MILYNDIHENSVQAQFWLNDYVFNLGYTPTSLKIALGKLDTIDYITSHKELDSDTYLSYQYGNSNQNIDNAISELRELADHNTTFTAQEVITLLNSIKE